MLCNQSEGQRENMVLVFAYIYIFRGTKSFTLIFEFGHILNLRDLWLHHLSTEEMMPVCDQFVRFLLHLLQSRQYGC